MLEARFQQPVIAFTKTLESLLKANLHTHERIPAGGRRMTCFRLVAAQQVFRHGRHDRSRQEI